MNLLARARLLPLVAALVLHVTAQGAQPAAQPLEKGPIACGTGVRKVDRQGYVRFGGIEQWVTVRGEDCANPVILWVHGGPGNPSTPFINSPYRAWEKKFTVVQWDQRGAGRTYARNPIDPETTEQLLTIEGLAKDGTEVAQWATRYLKKKKLILVGGSWGSALSVHMAQARPDLFVAYVGTGQLVNRKENDAWSYRKTLALARAAGDTKTVALLEGLGVPPWTNPRAPGTLRRATRVYEAKTSVPAPESWFVHGGEYATKQAQADYRNGEDFSWLQFVGIKGNGMQATLDVTKLGTDFQMPVFLLQGSEDLVTVPEVAKRYFDSIKAPQKEYFLVPAAGHDPNPPMVEAQYKVLETRVLPLLK